MKEQSWKLDLEDKVTEKCKWLTAVQTKLHTQREPCPWVNRSIQSSTRCKNGSETRTSSAFWDVNWTAIQDICGWDLKVCLKSVIDICGSLAWVWIYKSLTTGGDLFPGAGWRGMWRKELWRTGWSSTRPLTSPSSSPAGESSLLGSAGQGGPWGGPWGGPSQTTEDDTSNQSECEQTQRNTSDQVGCY